MFEEFKKKMAEEFEMINIDIMSYYFGIGVKQSDDGIFVSQKGYAKKALKEFKMKNYQPIITPMKCEVKLLRFDNGEKVSPTLYRKVVGNLRHLTCSRYDILYRVRLISRYMEAPTSSYMKAAKKILRYLKETLDYGLLYTSFGNFSLVGYRYRD
ncbi:uncharacterized mitochondrial protein AtMg00810-like [Ricinus communis]|uniref:uncharacterized mitochondrial protein AtMg00810-like n=1 Tax=Ricinus communis TaxID=3988 RepID=UPI00201AC819|nr:uncharacterized mitochondrial protein AtMg00810-like [Ricinus communis]